MKGGLPITRAVLEEAKKKKKKVLTLKLLLFANLPYYYFWKRCFIFHGRLYN